MTFRRWIGWSGLAAACLAAALVVTLWLSHQRTSARLREEIAFLKHEIALLDPQVAELRALKPAIQELLGRKQISEFVEASRYAVPLLEELARQRPEGVYLTGLREERRRILIDGYAASEREARALVANLGASGVLSGARLLESHAEGAGGLRFMIGASLKERR